MLQTKHRPAVTVAAAALLAFLVSSLLGLVPIISYALGGFTPGTDIGYVASQIGYDLATQGIPFGLGVYIVLAIFRPLRDAATVRVVLKNSVIAAAAGCGLLFVVTAVYATFRYGSFSGGVFGARFPEFSMEGSNIAFVFIDAIGSAALAFVRVAPVVALAGVLQWLWGSRTSHPPL
jgi:hypothetical protein